MKEHARVLNETYDEKLIEELDMLYDNRAKEIIFDYIDKYDPTIEITEYMIAGISLLLFRVDHYHNTLSEAQKDHIIKAYIGLEEPDYDLIEQVTAH